MSTFFGGPQILGVQSLTSTSNTPQNFTPIAGEYAIIKYVLKQGAGNSSQISVGGTVISDASASDQSGEFALPSSTQVEINGGDNAAYISIERFKNP